MTTPSQDKSDGGPLVAISLADDCALATHSHEDTHSITNHFSTACRHFCLAISLSKTEVVYQPAPPKAPNVPQPHLFLSVVEIKREKFCYFAVPCAAMDPWMWKLPSALQKPAVPLTCSHKHSGKNKGSSFRQR